MPKISVIIPVYGVEKYIERCAISLFEQTLEDIEYIFVNDCTKDGSMQILDKVLLRYPNRQQQTKIINMPVNSGLPSVRKCGIQHAKGEYIAHCDSDDWMDKNAFSILWEKAKDSDTDVVFYDYYKSNGTNNKEVLRQFDFSSNDNLINCISQNMYWNVFSSIVKRKIYTENDIIYPIYNNGEDFALMLQISYYAKSFLKVNKCLYYYYYNPESITNTPTKEAALNRFNQLIQNTELIIDFYKKQGKTDKFRDLITLYKLNCRTKISQLTAEPQYYKLWNSTYPELSAKDIVLNSNIPLRTRLHYLTVRLKVYKYLSLIFTKKN